jgi:actin-like protein 6A
MSRAAPKQYEFPTGYAGTFGAERYQVGEHIFYVSHLHLPLLVHKTLKLIHPFLRKSN